MTTKIVYVASNTDTQNLDEEFSWQAYYSCAAIHSVSICDEQYVWL